MARISAIVAMSENRVIGRDNRLPWHLPEDLKRFKKITMGKPVIMGRKTYESIGKPLPGRTNIVISRSNYQAPGITAVKTIEEALDEARKAAASDKQDEIFIIGGAEIFRQTLSVTERFYLTLIHDEIDGDAFLPPLNMKEWQVQERETFPATETHPAWSFTILERH